MIVLEIGSVSQKVKLALIGIGILSGLLFAYLATAANAAASIELPKSQIQAGMTVMQALEKRQTSRNFADTDLSPALLSHILWAANGINRSNSEGYTNPGCGKDVWGNL